MRRMTMAAAIAALLALWVAPAAQANLTLNGFDVTYTGADGQADLQAGSHPDAMTTSFSFDTVEEPGGIFPAESPKDIEIAEMPGFIGNQTAVPPCSTVGFLTLKMEPGGGSLAKDLPECSDSSAVGVATVTIGNSFGKATTSHPLYFLEAPPRRVAKLGFYVETVPITIDISVNEAPPYNLVVHSRNISQALEFFGAEVTLWGIPADPRHDEDRGTCRSAVRKPGNKCPAGVAERPFLIMPRACHGPLATSYESDSWQNPGSYLPSGAPDLSDPNWATGSSLTHDLGEPPHPEGMVGCGKLPFNPSIAAQPTSKAASSPTGLDFSLDVDDEGLTSAKEGAVAASDIEKTVVTLPEGFTTNPSLAEGLTTCSEADLARETAISEAGAGCPNESKIGSVEVESPLLDQSIKGSLYIATPYENPFGTLLALYVVLKNEELGISIKQPLKVETSLLTGQITTIAEDMPQLPFSHFRLHFREGTRSPLATPPACGSYSATATLYPYSGGAPVTSSSAFEIISGPDAGPCPGGGLPPFRPGLLAGSINNAAGHFSPFNLRLLRTDAEQEITHFSIKLPPGLSAKLAGIPFCTDAQIAAAEAREGTPHGGQEELDHPSCPAASEIGRTLVGSGVGPALAYAPGKVYLAGPYHGAPISVVAITAAKVGPFDLGAVVVREALRVNPETAEVFVDATGSDPIPHIIAGIPVHLRDIRVYVDRPGFALNPTSCEPTSTASTVLGSGLDFGSEADDNPVTVTTRYQAADCAALGFKPKLQLFLKGGTKRNKVPAFKAVLHARPGDANIAHAEVILPHSEFLEQGHIETVCTRVQFAEGGGNGEKCPAGSIYGHAKAITPLLAEPLEGPVFLRSNGGERLVPDLVAALHGQEINVDLVGYIDSVREKNKRGEVVSRIRNRFEVVPDAPVTEFVLEMAGGKKGLLVNSTNVCKSTFRADAKFTAHNGRVDKFRPALKAQCPKKGKKGGAKRKRRGR